MKGFISYAHKDAEAYRTFRTHLRAVEQSLGIEFWADEGIDPGDRWSAVIAKAIDNAQVHLLLMSPYFLASNYILDHELPAIARRLTLGALVIPVILQDCLWTHFVGPVQSVPKDAAGDLKPVRSWRPQSKGFHEANLQISNAIQKRFSLRPKSVL